MALNFSFKQLCFAFALFYLAALCCKAQGQQGQDAIQIVARAALCFDNRTVILNCMATLGLNGATNSTNNTNNTSNSTSGFCNGPCFGQAMLMISCIDGIMSNFQFYNAQMMQGVRSIFMVACGNNNSGSQGNMTAVPNYGNDIPQLSTWIMGLLASIWLL